jgi:hypothetical protein
MPLYAAPDGVHYERQKETTRKASRCWLAASATSFLVKQRAGSRGWAPIVVGGFRFFLHGTDSLVYADLKRAWSSRVPLATDSLAKRRGFVGAQVTGGVCKSRRKSRGLRWLRDHAFFDPR